MINQPSLERPIRTESSRRSNRREVKHRGILPSFGDIILPVVGIAAVGLLFIAGRQFFINGLNSSPGIASTRAYADSPVLIAEREKQEQEQKNENVSENLNLNTAENEQKDTAIEEIAVPGNPVKTETVIAIPEPEKKQTQIQTQTVKKTTKAPAVNNNLPASKQWRIQIGAYGTKQGAQEAANKINKAGYKTTVYKNPASKYYKVWVLGGASKQNAETVVSAMKKLGYKSSFTVPPPAK